MARDVIILCEIVKYGELDTSIMLDTFLNSTDECIVIINRHGFIEVLSKAYADFIQVDRDEVIGKHIVDVIENTRMHIVLETGISEIADTQIMNGQSMIASRIPIIQSGEVLGVLGRVLFKNVTDLKKLYEKISSNEKEVGLYKSAFSEFHRAKYALDDIITINSEMQRLKEIVKQVARTNSSVLLQGESGTGKELFAHAIHQESPRADGPFVSVNCGAIPSELLESELFGYESGAFTGANKKGKIGLLKVADHGTVFLDEIGELPIHLQAKILRFLQEREIKKVGSNTIETVDVRIVAATNRNLAEMMFEGTFRSDLFYRLSVVLLTIPPLRERRDDIRVLTDILVQKICKKERLIGYRISSMVRRSLQKYDWPGNVRELEHVLESAINFVAEDKLVSLNTLPTRITGINDHDVPSERISPEDIPELKASLETYERQLISDALDSCGQNKSRAAKLLGISRTNLYEKMEKLEMQS